MAKKQRIGTVVSIKNNKTIIANVQTRYQHPLYSKIISKIQRYVVHDPSNICYIGNKILIEETRPTSLNKRWILKSIYK
jgi:small subunit ribosomal protein S17